MGRGRRVGAFVQAGGHLRWRVGEACEVRHVHGVGGGSIIGLLSAARDADAKPRDEVFGVGDAFAFRKDGRLGRRVAVYLRHVEEMEAAREHAGFGLSLGFVVAVAGVDGFPDDAQGGPFALADLRAKLGPLAVGSPEAAGETAPLRGGPQGEDVHAAIGFGGDGVDRAVCGRAVVMPGHFPVTGAAFNGGDDFSGDAFVDGSAVGG